MDNLGADMNFNPSDMDHLGFSGEADSSVTQAGPNLLHGLQPDTTHPNVTHTAADHAIFQVLSLSCHLPYKATTNSIDYLVYGFF